MSEPEPQDFDTSKVPLGDLGWARLVDWAAGRGDDTRESDWLELKSDVDPSTKTGAAKVARFIIGAANRDPADAQRNMSGHAVLILGVGSGGVVGLPPVENLVINRLVQPFLGDAGPEWDIVRVSAGERYVLVFVVQPPKNGHPIFVARKNGDGIQDGQVYVRIDGATEPVTSSQFDRLQRRAAVVHSSAQLSIGIEGEIRSFSWDRSVLLRRLAGARTHLLSKLPSESPPIRPAALEPILRAQRTAAFMNPLTRQEDRSEEEYRDEVDEYFQLCAAKLSDIADQVIGCLAEPVSVRLVNEKTTFLSSVEVKLHVAGDVEAIPTSDNDGAFVSVLPARPRAWGPWTDVFGTTSYDLARSLSRHSPGPIRPLNPESRSRFETTGSVDATLWFKTVRGEAIIEEVADEALVVRDPNTKTLRVDWSATAADVHEVFKGNFELDVLPPIDVTSQVLAALEGML